MKENYAAWEIKPLDNLDISKEQLCRHLISWAILAPSTHNAQPWRFRLNMRENSIEICLDKTFVLPASDPTSRESLISLGCALENLVMSANSYGLGCRINFQNHSVKVWLTGLARLNCLDQKILAAIKNRRVNRGKFDHAQQIPNEIVQKFKDAASASGLTIDFVTDTASRFAIAELQYFADRYVITKTNFRNELANYLLPNDTIRKRGMPGATFDLEDNPAKEIHELLKTSGPFDPDLAAGFAIASRESTKSSPLLAVISIPEDKSIWWIKAGQLFEKIAILAVLENLAFAINAALIEVEIFNKMLKTQLGRKERPTILMRIGYPIHVFGHSPRVLADEITNETSEGDDS